MTNDPVNHPPHYTQHPSGVECIQITEHMGFNLGNAVKYIWRADLKGKAEDDLRKAAWYIERELQRRAAVRAAETRAARDLHRRRQREDEVEAAARALRDVLDRGE